MADLKQKIKKEEEKEVVLKTRDFFRPRLKHISNSIFEIKQFFTETNGVKIVPSKFPSPMVEVRDDLLKLLNEDGLLSTENVVTGSTVKTTPAQGFVFLAESLALALDFPISHRQDNVKCDAFIAFPNQPVIVLTFIGDGKETIDTRIYNTSVAKGVTTSLRKFTNESVNIVNGVICRDDLKNVKSVRNSLISFAKRSTRKVPPVSLTMNPLKYDLILTAFWAGVSETRSVLKGTSSEDVDFLRFLTTDQCITLVENINLKEVEVKYQPGCGATTLMLELARRLSRLNETLLVCTSRKEQEDLGSVFANTKIAADISMIDLSPYTNIVDETGLVTGKSLGRLWRFTKVYTDHDIEELQLRVKMLQKENANTEKMIYLLSSVDRREKMNHLSGETEILKLLEISFQGLFLIYHLPSILALVEKSVKQNTRGEGDVDEAQETKVYVRHVLDELKDGIRGRKTLSPLLRDMMEHVKINIGDLQTKLELLESALSGRPDLEDMKNQAKISLGQDHLRMEDDTHRKQIDGHLAVSGHSPIIDLKDLVPGGTPEVQQSTDDDVREETYSQKIDRLTKTAETLKTEADHKHRELMDLPEATEHTVEWECSMDCLSDDVAEMTIQDVINDVIGVNEIPVTTAKQMKFHASQATDDVSDTRRRDTRRCLVHQLNHLQYGKLTNRSLLDCVRDVITEDHRILISLKAQSDYLEQVCPLYVVEKKSSNNKHSRRLACPPMTLDRELVYKELAVSGDGLELAHTRGSLDQGTDRLKGYYGTCSRQPIPLPLSPSTLTVPRYWETHSRVQVKGPVSRLWILEMAVAREGKVDRLFPSWSVIVGGCYVHRGHICTKVLEEGRQVGNCLTDTMSPTPGTDVTLIYGAVLDIRRGRLAFSDVNRGRVLHKFDLHIRESLSPMFCTAPFKKSQCDVAMRLVSGREIAMTDKKKNLIATALYSQ